MKFDPKLVLDILQTLERDERLPKTNEVDYHLRLLSDKGYIHLHGSHLGYLREKDIAVYPDVCRLTWDGHMFLSQISQSDNYRGWVASLHGRVY